MPIVLRSLVARGAALFLLAGTAGAQMPSSVISARKAFVVGGNDPAHTAFFQDIQKWNRFEIVGSPREADIIVELSSSSETHSRPISVTNTYTHETQIISTSDVLVTFIVTLYDAQSHTPLWSEHDQARWARRRKSQDKEQLRSEQRLMEGLKRALQ